MRGTWQGSGTWQSSGGPDLSGLIAVAVLAGVIYAVAEIVLALIWWIVAAVGIALAVAVVLLIRRARQDRPGRPIAARVVHQIPPATRPQLEVPHIPELGPGRELHIHLHGLTPEQIAAIVTHRGGYPEEGR